MGNDRMAIGYARVSSQEQTEGDSIETQVNTIKEYCKFKRLVLDTVLTEEGESAGISLKKRTQGARLTELIRSGKYTDVVFTRLDRAFRNVIDCLQMIEEWENLGLAIHIKDLGGQSIDTSSAMGRCFVTVVAAFGQLERDLISERTKEVMITKRSKGEYCGGGIPYGFQLDESGEILVPHKSEQEAIRAAKKMRVRGDSYRSIADSLTEMGHTPRNGSSFYPQTIKRMITKKQEITIS